MNKEKTEDTALVTLSKQKLVPVKIKTDSIKVVKTRPKPFKKEPVRKKVPQVYKEQVDTIFHYYNNKKVSVKISPWKNDERKVMLFFNGLKAYEMEEIRKSYSQSVNLKFHSNGAVSSAKVSFNPGASMYWYETDITFSGTNEPESKREMRLPLQSINDPYNNTYLWDKIKKVWIKQETIPCQPVTKPLTK